MRRSRAKSRALLVTETVDVSASSESVPRAKKRRRSPRVVGTVDVVSVPYSVVIAHPDDTAGTLTDNDHGACDEERLQLILHEGRNFNGPRAWSNLAHEVLHAWFRESGAENFIHEKTGKPESIDDLIEHIIRMLTPALLSSFDDLASIKRLLMTEASR